MAVSNSVLSVASHVCLTLYAAVLVPYECTSVHRALAHDPKWCLICFFHIYWYWWAEFTLEMLYIPQSVYFINILSWVPSHSNAFNSFREAVNHLQNKNHRKIWRLVKNGFLCTSKSSFWQWSDAWLSQIWELCPSSRRSKKSNY